MRSETELAAVEQRLAKDLYAAVQHATNFSVRSMQSKEFKVGISDLGYCSERTRRMLDQQVPEDTDMLAAFIGTALGDHIEQAAMVRWPNAIRQATVTLTLEGDQRSYEVSGHPDLILPDEGMLVDFKTKFGLDVVRKTGPSQQQQFQRHCYAKGAWEAGFFGDLPLEDVLVANAWMDRSGREKEFHVHVEPFDQGMVDAAAQWLDDVVYAFLHQEEARKEPPREVCAATCGFYGVCRAYDTDVEGLIRDPDMLAAVDLYRQGTRMMSDGKSLQSQAKQVLKGVEGSTGEFTVRWTHVNETVIPEQTRAGYEKLEVRPIPRSRR